MSKLVLMLSEQGRVELAGDFVSWGTSFFIYKEKFVCYRRTLYLIYKENVCHKIKLQKLFQK